MVQLEDSRGGRGSQQPGDSWGTILAQAESRRDIDSQLVQLDGPVKYSDELANGDSADDRDIHEDEDMNDDVVDVNGHTNAGYGAYVPATFFTHNHIMEGSHIQEPRDKQFVHLY